MRKMAFIIMAKNEECHAQRIVAECTKIVDVEDIFVFDSSENRDYWDLFIPSVNIKHFEQTAKFCDKVNFAIDTLKKDYRWLFRLDCDEIISSELEVFLKRDFDDSLSAFAFPWVYHFCGKPLYHGGMYPRPQVRLFQPSCAKMEDRYLDEHMEVDGEIKYKIGCDIYELSLYDFLHWLHKHSLYAKLEVLQSNTKTRGKKSSHKKRDFYDKFPKFLRVLVLFLYDYILRLGFKDGWHGFLYHFYKCFYYRMTVDLLLYLEDKDKDNDQI